MNFDYIIIGAGSAGVFWPTACRKTALLIFYCWKLAAKIEIHLFICRLDMRN